MTHDKTYILETGNGNTITILGTHEAEFQIDHRKIVHTVFIADILDDVIFDDICARHNGETWFQIIF